MLLLCSSYRYGKCILCVFYVVPKTIGVLFRRDNCPSRVTEERELIVFVWDYKSD